MRGDKKTFKNLPTLVCALASVVLGIFVFDELIFQRQLRKHIAHSIDYYFGAQLPKTPVDAEERKKKTLIVYKNSKGSNRVAAFRQLYSNESLLDELVEVLMRNGDKELAEAFLDASYHVRRWWMPGFLLDKHESALRNAGITWAERHGYKVWRKERGSEVSYSLRSPIQQHMER